MERRLATQRPRGANFVIGVESLIVVVIVFFWTTWFLAPEMIQARSPDASDYQIYVYFEQAFILADCWVAISLLIGAVGLWRMRDWGLLFALLAGGGCIFLALMDLLYDLQHGMFVPLTSEAGTELIIVVLTLSLTPLSMYLLWRHRRMFIK
jgi:hypothetical protein